MGRERAQVGDRKVSLCLVCVLFVKMKDERLRSDIIDLQIDYKRIHTCTYIQAETKCCGIKENGDGSGRNNKQKVHVSRGACQPKHLDCVVQKYLECWLLCERMQLMQNYGMSSILFKPSNKVRFETH